MFKRVAAGVAVLAIAGLGLWWFASEWDREYPRDVVGEWCSHAQALREAKLLDRAYVAYRRLHAAGGECDSAEELAALRFDIKRREQLIEGARAFRRAADLSKSPELREGRQDAIRDAFAAYQDALEKDPYARGGRRAFVRLVASYRRIDPEAPDCTRAQGVAAAGLLPEGRLYLSRALRTREGGVCRRGLEWLGERRAEAYRHLRVGEAREKAGDERGARAAYAAALRDDSSEPLALAGLGRVEPPSLQADGGWSRDSVAFLGNVKDVVPAAMQAFLAIIALALIAFMSLWFGARSLANRSSRARRWIERRRWLSRTLETRVQTEGTAELKSPVSGIVEDTLARLHTPWIDPTTGKIQSSVATPRGSQAEVDELFTAVEPVALAAQVLRRAAALLRTTSDVALVLEKATGDDDLEQRWRIIDRRTRRTLARMQFHQRQLSFVPDDPHRRVEFFIIRAAEELRAKILEAETIRASSVDVEFKR
jgi:hypothetical protein